MQQTMENFAAEVPADLLDADDLLLRYGRWATQGQGSFKLQTLDRYYKPTAWQAIEPRRTPAPFRLSTAEAMLYQRALARVPDAERIVLTVLYIPRRNSPEDQLRMLRIPPRVCRERHLRGLRAFDNIRRLSALPGR